MNSARAWVIPLFAPRLSWVSRFEARSRTNNSSSRTNATFVPSRLSFGSISGLSVRVNPLERPLAPLEKEVALKREDREIGLLAPDDLGDAGFAQPLTFAPELLGLGERGLGVALAGRPGHDPGFSSVEGSSRQSTRLKLDDSDFR